MVWPPAPDLLRAADADQFAIAKMSHRLRGLLKGPGKPTRLAGAPLVEMLTRRPVKWSRRRFRSDPLDVAPDVRSQLGR